MAKKLKIYILKINISKGKFVWFKHRMLCKFSESSEHLNQFSCPMNHVRLNEHEMLSKQKWFSSNICFSFKVPIIMYYVFSLILTLITRKFVNNSSMSKSNYNSTPANTTTLKGNSCMKLHGSSQVSTHRFHAVSYCRVLH